METKKKYGETNQGKKNNNKKVFRMCGHLKKVKLKQTLKKC